MEGSPMLSPHTGDRGGWPWSSGVSTLPWTAGETTVLPRSLWLEQAQAGDTSKSNELQLLELGTGFLLSLGVTKPVEQRRQWHPTPVPLLGKPHGRRSLVGCSPWGHKESDMTEQLHFQFSLSCIGEGNGNPLQCSCLENPRDRRAWWAVIYGIAQSRTRLKWLSSSSSSKPVETVSDSIFGGLQNHRRWWLQPWN